MIRWIEDKDIFWHIYEYDAILVGTNIFGYMTNGFQRKIRKEFPKLAVENAALPYGDLTRMGTMLTRDFNGLSVSLLYIVPVPFKTQSRFGLMEDVLCYDCLEKCLSDADSLYSGMRVATTLLGTSRFDGCGNRERVLDIFNNTVKQMDLTIYDYKQLTPAEEVNEINRFILKYKYIDPKLFKRLWAEKKKMHRKLRIYG